MLRFWLARHGEAVDPDQAHSDFERTLTENGRRRMLEMTRWLREREEPPELILHSPLVRARQTAEAIAGELESAGVTIRVETRLAPGINSEELLRYLGNMTVERVVCVGHQPDMSRCLAEIIGGGNIHFFPGTMASVEFHGPIMRGGGILRWVTDPHWFG